MVAVRFSEHESAFDIVNFGSPYESDAYICRETGRVYRASEFIDDEEQEAPDDLGESDRYIAVPDRSDLDLGKRLVLRFVGSELPESLDEVGMFFRRAGAYGRYKELLHSRGLLESWYKSEEEEARSALRAWWDSEGIEIVDDLSNQEQPKR